MNQPDLHASPATVEAVAEALWRLEAERHGYDHMSVTVKAHWPLENYMEQARVAIAAMENAQ